MITLLNRSRVGVLLAFIAASIAAQAPQAPSADTSATRHITVDSARAAIQHGKEKDAIAALHAVAQLPTPPAGVHRELGIAYYRLGNLKDARASFIAALVQNPVDMESVRMLGLTLFRSGDHRAAIPYLERSRYEAAHSDIDTSYVLGRCYIELQRYDEARRAFAAQYNVAPDSAAAYLLLAQMLLRNELPDVARENAEAALAKSPQLARAHFILGKIYLAKGDTARALLEFEQEKVINPTYPPLYQFLGDLYLRAAQNGHAQHALTMALSLDQTDTGPFILMGKLFLEDDDPGTAVTYLEHAEQMDPSNFIVHNLLGQAYRRLDRREDAKREYDMVAKAHANGQE